jgi:hypothetical protein
MSLYGTRNQGLNLRRDYGRAAAGASALTGLGAALPQLSRAGAQIEAQRAQKAADELQFSRHYDAQKAVVDANQRQQGLDLDRSKTLMDYYQNQARQAMENKQFNRQSRRDDFERQQAGREFDRQLGRDSWDRMQDNANYGLSLDRAGMDRAKFEQDAEDEATRRKIALLQAGRYYEPKSLQGLVDSDYQDFSGLQLRPPARQQKVDVDSLPSNYGAYYANMLKQKGYDTSYFADPAGKASPVGNAFTQGLDIYAQQNPGAPITADVLDAAYRNAFPNNARVPWPTAQTAAPQPALALPQAQPNPTPVQTPPQAGPLPPSYQVRQTSGTQGLALPTTGTQAAAAAPAPKPSASRSPADQFADQYRAAQPADDWSQMDDSQIAAALAGEGYAPAQIQAVLAEVSRQRSRM